MEGLLALHHCRLCEFAAKHLVVSLGLMFASGFVCQEGELYTERGSGRESWNHLQPCVCLPLPLAADGHLGVHLDCALIAPSRTHAIPLWSARTKEGLLENSSQLNQVDNRIIHNCKIIEENVKIIKTQRSRVKITHMLRTKR